MSYQKGFGVVQVLLLIVIIGLVGGTGYYVWQNRNIETSIYITDDQPSVINFDECVAAGNPVMESYPEQCSANGQTFVNDNRQVDVEIASKYDGERKTSSKGGFSIIVLNGWKLDTDTTYDYLFTYDIEDLVYDSNKKPNINEVDGSGVGGWVPGIGISSGKNITPVTNADSNITLSDGTVGQCEGSTNSEDVLRESGGATDRGSFVFKRCVFDNNRVSIQAVYGYYQKFPLDVDAVEWVFQTIEFAK